jgi:hypothetical protein
MLIRRPLIYIALAILQQYNGKIIYHIMTDVPVISKTSMCAEHRVYVFSFDGMIINITVSFSRRLREVMSSTVRGLIV